MSKKSIKDTIGCICEDYFREEGYTLYHVDFLKEGTEWFLRVFIDNQSGKPISIDDCEKVNRFIGQKLDQEDSIEQSYYLEVSSPGIDRELHVEENFRTYVGEAIELRLYRPIENEKSLTVILKAVEKDNDGNLTLTVEYEGREILVEKSMISKAKLAVMF